MMNGVDFGNRYSLMILINIKKEKMSIEDNDKAARMNKFFEEMNMKIEAEEKGTPIKQPKIDVPPAPKPTTQVPPVRKSYMDELKDLDNKADNLPPIPPIEEKQTFLEAMKELKAELDPKADKLMDSAFSKAKDLFGKAEKGAKSAFNKFDSYTDDLEARMKKQDEAEENLKKTRRERNLLDNSLFEGTGGLFEKAANFVKGEKKTAPKDGEIKIIQPDKKPKKTPNPNDTVYGFEDLDGDGNPFIDDAIVEK